MHEKVIITSAKILALILVAVASYFLLAPKVPTTKYVQETLTHLEDDKSTVAKVSAATIGTSFAISFLPDDIGSPVANTLAEMNKVVVLLLTVIFVERLIVVEGIKIVFMYLVPVACGMYILGLLSKKFNFLRNVAIKLAILSAAIVCVIPFATHFARAVGNDYLVYVNETVDETSAGIEQITNSDEESTEDKSFLDKVSDTWHSATQGVSDAVAFIKGGITKFANAIAILIVTTFVLPLLILFFFRWLLNQLFSINLNLQKRYKGNAIEGNAEVES